MTETEKLEIKKERQREANRWFYAKNREKCLAWQAEWRANNPKYQIEWNAKNPEKKKAITAKVNASPRAKERQARWRAENPEKIAAATARNNAKDGKDRNARLRAKKIAADPVGARLEAARKVAEWREKNKDLHAQTQKAWREANKELIMSYGVERRLKLKKIGRLSRGLSKKLLEEQGWKCPYCPADFHIVPFAQDHFVPIKRGGPNEDWNIQLVCKPCNSKKAAKDPADFLKEIFPD